MMWSLEGAAKTLASTSCVQHLFHLVRGANFLCRIAQYTIRAVLFLSVVIVFCGRHFILWIILCVLLGWKQAKGLAIAIPLAYVVEHFIRIWHNQSKTEQTNPSSPVAETLDNLKINWCDNFCRRRHNSLMTKLDCRRFYKRAWLNTGKKLLTSFAWVTWAIVLLTVQGLWTLPLLLISDHVKLIAASLIGFAIFLSTGNIYCALMSFPVVLVLSVVIVYSGYIAIWRRGCDRIGYFTAYVGPPRGCVESVYQLPEPLGCSGRLRKMMRPLAVARPTSLLLWVSDQNAFGPFWMFFSAFFEFFSTLVYPPSLVETGECNKTAADFLQQLGLVPMQLGALWSETSSLPTNKRTLEGFTMPCITGPNIAEKLPPMAVSYVQRREDDVWILPEDLFLDVMVLVEACSPVWFDRMASAQHGGESEWAEFGLLPYMTYPVLIVPPATRLLSGKVIPGAAEDMNDLIRDVAQWFYCVRDSECHFTLRQWCLCEMFRIEAYGSEDEFYNGKLSGRLSLFEVEEWLRNVDVCDLVGMTRAWPTAERVCGAACEGIWVTERGGQVVINTLAMLQMISVASRSELLQTEATRLLYCLLSPFLEARTIGQSQKSDVRSMAQALWHPHVLEVLSEQVKGPAVALSALMGSSLFWESAIHTETDKAEAVFGSVTKLLLNGENPDPLDFLECLSRNSSMGLSSVNTYFTSKPYSSRMLAGTVDCGPLALGLVSSKSQLLHWLKKAKPDSRNPEECLRSIFARDWHVVLGVSRGERVWQPDEESPLLESDNITGNGPLPHPADGHNRLMFYVRVRSPDSLGILEASLCIGDKTTVRYEVIRWLVFSPFLMNMSASDILRQGVAPSYALSSIEARLLEVDEGVVVSTGSLLDGKFGGIVKVHSSLVTKPREMLYHSQPSTNY